MNTPVKLATFAVGLAALFGASVGIGAAVGPVGPVGPPVEEIAPPGHGPAPEEPGPASDAPHEEHGS